MQSPPLLPPSFASHQQLKHLSALKKDCAAFASSYPVFVAIEPLLVSCTNRKDAPFMCCMSEGEDL
jgi:hypothetical protein